MFFLISKLLINLIYPLTWIIILIILALITKAPRVKKSSLTGALILLLLFSNPFLLDIFARQWDIDTKAGNTTYSCAIILGGFVSEDQNNHGYFNSSSDRFIQSLKLISTGRTKHVLYSGGNADLNPSKFREAEWIEQQLRDFRVPESRVIIENRSRNTLENAGFSKALLNARHLAPPYLLVTSAFHMRRSLLTFRKAGLNVVPYSCDYIAGRETISLKSFVPSASTLLRWNFYIKEVIGYAAYSLKS